MYAFRPLVLACALAFTLGCSSARQQQAASNALAGLDALSTFLDPALMPVVAGVGAYIEAAVETPRAELPPPDRDAAAVLADKAGYKSDALKAREDSLSGGWLAWVVGGALVIAGIVKRTGLGGPLANMAATWVENAAQRRAKEKAQVLQAGFPMLVQIIDTLPNEGTVGDLKKRISKTVPPEVLAAIHEIKPADPPAPPVPHDA